MKLVPREHDPRHDWLRALCWLVVALVLAFLMYDRHQRHHTLVIDIALTSDVRHIAPSIDTNMNLRDVLTIYPNPAQHGPNGNLLVCTNNACHFELSSLAWESGQVIEIAFAPFYRTTGEQDPPEPPRLDEHSCQLIAQHATVSASFAEPHQSLSFIRVTPQGGCLLRLP